MTEVVKSYNQPNFYTVPKKLFRALNERLSDSEYPCKHRWNLISKAKIATITGGSSAFKEMTDFCDASGVPFEYMLCWTQLLLSCVEYEANPVLSTKWDDDFDGNWDFEISLCDNVYVPRKNPISLPRNDKLGRYLNRPIKNATRPISSVAPKLIPTDVDPSEEPKQSSKKNSPPTTKVTYTFGVQYFPASKIFKLRYSLYPQKHLWGLRFVERYRTFEDLIEIWQLLKISMPLRNEERCSQMHRTEILMCLYVLLTKTFHQKIDELQLYNGLMLMQMLILKKNIQQLTIWFYEISILPLNQLGIDEVSY